jgi:DNA-binding MarR family transcriptional regulator
MPTPPIADTYGSVPELMRVARGSYKRAVDARLAAGGFDDLPNPGGYLLAYLANDEESVPERIEGLGIKKREFSQLVDTLVLRGYITRAIDPKDRTVSFVLTERGRAANEASYEGARYVDESWSAGSRRPRWPACAVDSPFSARSSSPCPVPRSVAAWSAR